MSVELTEEEKRKKGQNIFCQVPERVTVYTGVLSEGGARYSYSSTPSGAIPLTNTDLWHNSASGTSDDSTVAESPHQINREKNVSVSPRASHTSTHSESSVTPSVYRGFGIFRPRTAFAASLQKGTHNEVNPARDYVRAGVLAIAALTCIGLAAAHGNIPFIVAWLVLLGIALFLYCRAVQADPKSANTLSLARDLGLSRPTLL